MNKEQFWSLIDAVNKESDQTQDGILLATQKKLLELSAREIIDFHNYLKLYMDLADTPNLVAAAVAINDGVSDDGFTDFWAWLVSLGEEKYRNALKKADSLAEIEIDPEPYATQFECYGYIDSYAYEVKKLLEQKELKEVCENEYFSLTPKGLELAQQILDYHSAYQKPFSSEDPVVRCLYHLLKGKLGAASVYDDAAEYPLSKQQEKEICDELEFETPVPRPRRWTPEALQKTVPELYSKYCEHGYTLGGM